MDRREEMEKIVELEKTVRDLRQQNTKLKAIIEEYKSKEQTISSAIIASMEHANQLEASRKKLYSLDMQRNRLMYLRMEQVINELYRKYPELKKDTQLKDISEKFKLMLDIDLKERTNSVTFNMKKQTMTDDPIKKLLHNIIDCFDTKKADEKEDNLPLMDNPTSSGFDFNEALHPTMELDEIMKAFDLTNKNKDEKNGAN